MTAALTSVGVQQVSITIANGSTTGTATITAVGTGAFIIWQGQTTTDSTTSLSAMARVEITNTTTVTATRNTSSTDTITVFVDIVDGDTTNFVKSVQNITTSIASGSLTGTTTITAVTNNNTFVTELGSSTAAILSITRTTATITLAGTTVTATRGVATGADVFGSCVVELQGAALNSATQNITVGSAASGTSFTTTITSVTTTNTLLANGGMNSTISASNARAELGRYSLAAATTAQVDVNTAPSSTGSTYAMVVVELVAAMLAQNIQRGTTALSAATSNTSTITSAVVAQSIVNWLNNTTTASTDNHAINDFKITQTNTTTLTMTANSSASGTGSWEVITLNGVAASASASGFNPYYSRFIGRIDGMAGSV